MFVIIIAHLSLKRNYLNVHEWDAVLMKHITSVSVGWTNASGTSLLFVHPTWKSFSICGNYNFTYFAYSTSFHGISITTGSLQLEVLVISPFPPLLHLSFLHSIELLALTNSTQKLMLDRKRWANSLILQHSPSRVDSPRPQTWKLEVGCN